MLKTQVAPPGVARWAVAVALPAAVLLSGCEGTLGDGPSDQGGGNVADGAGGQGSGAGGEVATGAGVGGAASGAGGAGGGGAPWQPVETDWCSPGWLGLDDHTCFYAPASIESPVTVLFFLHGMMPPDASPASLQSIAQQAADDRGFVAVFPRGEQGLCAWDPSVVDWWCWPTSRTTVDSSAAALLDGWEASQSVLEGALGLAFERRYVMGFSNGGYFSAYIGLEGLLPANGFGVVGAGRSSIDESLMPPASEPFYIAVGSLEPKSTQDSASNLSIVLDKHTWPNDLIVHSDRGHEIRLDDFDGAAVSWGWP